MQDRMLINNYMSCAHMCMCTPVAKGLMSSHTPMKHVKSLPSFTKYKNHKMNDLFNVFLCLRGK